MTDDKSPFDKFISSIWSKVSAFITAVATIVGFVTIFQDKLEIVGLIILGLITVMLLIASIGWYTRRFPGGPIPPIPPEGIKKPLLPSNWQKAARITLSIVVLGWIAWGIYFVVSYKHKQQEIAELEEKVVILVADIDGPDPKKYRVTEELTTQLRDSLSDYNDTKIINLGETITEQQGNDYARNVGIDQHADVVLWGYYGATSTDVRLTLHVENLLPDKFMIIDEGETLYTQAAISELDSFTLQQDVSKQMSALVLFLSGYARFQANDFHDALERFDKALTQTTWGNEIVNITEVLYYRGSAHFSLKSWENAITDYTKTINNDPNFLAAYNNRGLAYIELKLSEQAIADFTKAIQIDPTLPEIYINRGIAYDNQNKYEQAIADYTTAIQVDPTHAQFYVNRGITYDNQNKYEQAIADYTTAIQIDPSMTRVYGNRGFSYASNGQFDLAINDFTKAIQLDPTVVIYAGRALSYVAQNKNEQAIVDYTSAIHLDPFNAKLYYERGMVYTFQKQNDNAIADFTEAIKYDEDLTDAYYNRGITYVAQGQYDLAILDFTKAISNDPNLADAFTYRGFSFATQDRYEQAVADFTEVIKLNPDLAEAYSNRGSAYIAQGQYDLALTDYQHALTLTGDPDLIAKIERSVQALKEVQSP